MCKNWREKGACRYGDKCLFAHGEHELSRRQSIETNDANKTSSACVDTSSSKDGDNKSQEGSANMVGPF